MKYHLSLKTGRPNQCHATKRACPVGGDEVHFANKEDAQAAYEQKMKDEAVPAGVKKNVNVEELRKAYYDAVRHDGPDRGERITAARTKLEAALPPPPTPSEIISNIATPPGFTRTEGTWEGYVWGNQPPKNLPQLVFEGDGITIKINFGDDADGYILADGHVTFTSSQGVRTFDRRGVDDSFYIDNPRKNYRTDDGSEAVNETIRDFIERKVPESRARIDGSETVPGLAGRLVTADQKARLANEGQLQLVPAGFGTGYHLSTFKPSGVSAMGAREASAEQKAFFNTQQLWITEFDCD